MGEIKDEHRQALPTADEKLGRRISGGKKKVIRGNHELVINFGRKNPRDKSPVTPANQKSEGERGKGY